MSGPQHFMTPAHVNNYSLLIIVPYIFHVPRSQVTVIPLPAEPSDHLLMTGIFFECIERPLLLCSAMYN